MRAKFLKGLKIKARPYFRKVYKKEKQFSFSGMETKTKKAGIKFDVGLEVPKESLDRVNRHVKTHRGKYNLLANLGGAGLAGYGGAKYGARKRGKK